jgi:hypothetical protein
VLDASLRSRPRQKLLLELIHYPLLALWNALVPGCGPNLPGMLLDVTDRFTALKPFPISNLPLPKPTPVLRPITIELPSNP